MKTLRIGIVAVVLTLLAGAPAVAQTGQDLLQQALVMEQAEGNLPEAIRLYQRIVQEFGSDRPLAARALVQMGRCHEKLGSQEAERAYRLVVSDYADQREFVAQARELLAAMERAPETRPRERSITARKIHKWVYGEAIPLAITPDGTGLVYSDLWSGNLAIRDLTNGQDRNLTQDATWLQWGAAVSPDGRTVSYLMAEGATSSLHLVGIDGSDPRGLNHELGCAVSSHEWTSDGEHIVAVVSCGGDLSVRRISVPDGDAELVRELDPGRLGPISLSPDDRYLTYGLAVEGDGGNSDIWMLSLDGTTIVPLVQHPANDQLLEWVPETDEVWFLSDRDGTMDVWALRTTDGAPEGPPRMVQRSVGHVDPLGFARDGALFYSTYKRWFSTGVAPFDLTTGTVAMESRVGLLGSNMPATWSPDGRYLAFVPEQQGPSHLGGPYKRPLHVRDLSTGSEREFASHLQTRNQKWSPDGRFILLSGFDPIEDGARYLGGLFIVELESGQTTQVMELNEETRTVFWSDLGAEWSKDGTAIIYSIYENNLGEGRMVWLDLESGEERELFRDPTLTSRQFAVSPDGDRLVFALRNAAEGYSTGIHSGGRLLIMDLDGGDTREFHQITEEGRVASLQWTPDGEHVLYTKRTDDHGTAVWRVPITGGPAEVTWTFEEHHFDAYVNLSPDGRRVAYTTYHQEYEVWVMENLFAGGGPSGR
jgi:Tol biopolymer transport system component